MSIANELITRGWTQGAFENDSGEVCLAGAIELAYHGDIWRAKKRLLEKQIECAVAKNVIMQLIGEPIPIWNDTPERTFDEVLRVAKEADEILDAR